MVTFFASFLIWLMFAFLFALWLFHHKFDAKAVFYALFVSFIAWNVSEFFKYVFRTERPFAAGNFTPLTLTIPSGFAFPSSHTAIAFSLSSGVLKKDSKMGVICFLLAIGVAFGRIASHVHYLIDIFGGAFVGLATFYVLEKFSFSKKFFK